MTLSVYRNPNVPVIPGRLDSEAPVVIDLGVVSGPYTGYELAPQAGTSGQPVDPCSGRELAGWEAAVDSELRYEHPDGLTSSSRALHLAAHSPHMRAAERADLAREADDVLRTAERAATGTLANPKDTDLCVFQETRAAALPDRGPGNFVRDPQTVIENAQAAGEIVVGGLVVGGDLLHFLPIRQIAGQYRALQADLASLPESRADERPALEIRLQAMEHQLVELAREAQARPDNLPRLRSSLSAETEAPVPDSQRATRVIGSLRLIRALPAA